jgi:hypothetical protein
MLCALLVSVACGSGSKQTSGDDSSVLADVPGYSDFCIIGVTDVESGLALEDSGVRAAWECKTKQELEASLEHIAQSLSVVGVVCALTPGGQHAAMIAGTGAGMAVFTKYLVSNVACTPGEDISAAQRQGLARASCAYFAGLGLPCDKPYDGVWTASDVPVVATAENPVVYNVKQIEFRPYTGQELTTRHGDGMAVVSIQVCRLDSGCVPQMTQFPLSYWVNHAELRLFQRVGAGAATIEIKGRVNVETDAEAMRARKMTFSLERTVGPDNGLLRAIANMKVLVR